MGRTDRLILLYKRLYGRNPHSVERINNGGSHREYYRLWGENTSVIGTIGVSKEENEAFIYLSNKFKEDGLNVPSILIVGDDRTAYLQTDIDRFSLYDKIREAKNSEDFFRDNIMLLKKIIHDLVKFHKAGKDRLNFRYCYPVAEMDRIAILWDLNYFKYCFLKAIGFEIDEPKLEKEFGTICERCSAKEDDGFIYRDFQSRNILINSEGEPGYIDFQGGRKGNGIYDLVSFLWQSRIKFPEEIKLELIEEYLKCSGENKDRSKFYNDLNSFRLLRGLQNLGAYGLRGITERKELFKESIKQALLNLKSLPDNVFERLPYIKSIIDTCAIRFTDMPRPEGLTVTVGSFSYKKGLPEDNSGNGGGFIFDCRGLNNPGRYEEFKRLTGRDKDVARFIEADESSEKFLKNIFELIDISIKEYLRRGFSSLHIWTGCTGGQHRSVYFAEKIAHYVYDKFHVRVHLIHREQGIDEIFETL